ncbi:hypothetical protein D9756_007521 [Leucocoprinus leucothites]|uniref:DUF300-domain-containing protein n=1 Tax=Leucocoprinus leucothites TaxID=201217 RepID=A0A8H5FWW8_9AGAR|nr:hypothetical protein D9756_007521 [Leucoagaricus leucothites]
MASPQDSEVCRKERAEDPPSLFQNGKIVIQTHHIGWIIAGCFTVIAAAISFWLVNKHLQWYTNKREQRYIVRILFMVPLYAAISFASYLWWDHATPIILIRDGYESTVLTAFFYLLLMYLSHDPEEQRLIFLKHGLSRQNDAERIKKREPVQRWVFPLGFIKWKPADGLFFLQLMKWGVLQYCVLRPLTTLSAVVLDYLGLYCESSWGLGWGHIYITIIVSISVTIAMYCLIQLYIAVSKDLARHKPLLKLFAIKAVVFLTFWQATFLSVLSLFGVVKDTQYMTAEDINIGIGALLETFEMMLFALLHVKAFTYKVYRPPYDPTSDPIPPEKTPRLKSLGHAMDFRETFRELWVGCVYMWHDFRGKEPAIDTGAIRATYYEGVFGKQRPTRHQRHQDDDTSNDDNIDLKQPTLPRVQVEINERIEVDVGGEKQWLGTGDNYGYGLKFLRRERSEGLEEQIEKELEKRGYTLRNEDDDDMQSTKHSKQKSWWRSIYNRISHTGHDDSREIEGNLFTNVPPQRVPSRNRTRRQSRSKRKDGNTAQRLLPPMEVNAADLDLEDQPPPSLIVRKNRRELRRSVDKWRQNVVSQIRSEDILMPLPEPLQEQVGTPRTGRHEYKRVHENRHHAEPLSDMSSPPNIETTPVIDPRQTSPLQSPGSEGRRLERMFKGTTNDSPMELHRVRTGTAQSEISSAEGYRLAKPTPPILLIPSQPPAITANQLGMSSQQHSAQYHLTDGDVHIPMTADVVVAGNHLAEGQGDCGVVSISTSPAPTHRRESASSRIHNPDLNAFPILPRTSLTPTRQMVQQQPPQAGPSTSPTSPPPLRSPPALRRSSAQYYSSQFHSHKRRSIPLNVDTPYPNSVSPPGSPVGRKQPRHIRQGHLVNEDTSVSSNANHNHTRQVLSTSTSPRSHHFIPSSIIDDGLSRYPTHFSPKYSAMPRNS